MKIFIKSNFVIPGLKEKDCVDIERAEISLKEFLETLSVMSPIRIEFIRPEAKTLNPNDWEVEINGIPYQNFDQGLETSLRNGDVITIRILVFGGG